MLGHFRRAAGRMQALVQLALQDIERQRTPAQNCVMKSAHFELWAEGASGLFAQTLNAELPHLIGKLAAGPQGTRNLAIDFLLGLPGLGQKILLRAAFTPAVRVNSSITTRTARVSSMRSSPNSSYGSLYKPISLPRPSA